MGNLTDLNFNANTEEATNDGFDPLPDGVYLALIMEAEKKENNKKTGYYLNIRLQCFENNNKNVFDIINLWNQSEKATSIARANFKDLCMAIGVPEPNDSNELLNKVLAIDVYSEEYNGKINNRVRRYLPASAVESVKQPNTQQSASNKNSGDSRPWIK